MAKSVFASKLDLLVHLYLLLLFFAAIPAPVFSDALSASTATETLEARYPGPIRLDVNVVSDSIATAFFNPISINQIDPQVTEFSKDIAPQLVRKFLADNNDLFQVEQSELVEGQNLDKTVRKATPVRISMFKFNQVVDGYPVFGGYLQATFRNGALSKINNKTFPNVEIPNETPMTQAEAADKAKHFELTKGYLDILDQVPVTEPVDLNLINLLHGELGIYPIPARSGYFYRLAWKLDLSAAPGTGEWATYYLDASGGAILKRVQRGHGASIGGKLTGTVYPEDNRTGSQTSVELANIRIGVQGSNAAQMSTLTQYNGYYYLPDVSPIPTPMFLYADFGNTPYRILKNASPFESQINLGNTMSSQPVNKILVSPASPGGSYDITLTDSDNMFVREAVNVAYHFDLLNKFMNKGEVIDMPPFGETLEQYVVLQPPPNIPNFQCNGQNITLTSGINSPVTSIIYLGGELILPSGEKVCESSAFNSDLIYHEYGHSVSLFAYDKDFSILGTKEGRAIDEGQSDYWAATMNAEPSVMENLDKYNNMTHGNWGPWRNISNTKKMVPITNPDDEYWFAEIIGGALWDYRLKMMAAHPMGNGLPYDDPYWTPDGKDLADEFIYLTLFEKPDTFTSFLDNLISLDAEDWQIICEAFETNHDIHPFYHPCNQPPYSGGGGGGGSSYPRGPADVFIPLDRAFVDLGTFTTSLLGTAKIGGFTNYQLNRSPHKANNWSTSGISAAAGGTLQVNDGELGSLNPQNLINGCFYDVKLTVNSSSLPSKEDEITIKKIGTTVAEMPRMACVSRTAYQGGENDACQVIAIMSDPKIEITSLAYNDWRRGRPARLHDTNESQFLRVAWSGVPVMCDPDNNGGDCLRDCWNITGTNGNQSSGNDGLDNIFCASNGGCSPVSFSGCEATNEVCEQNAAQALEDIYHKVLYLHYANSENDGFMGIWGTERVNFQDCDDDDGKQYYAIMNKDQVNWRKPRCADPRCEGDRPLDLFDQFPKLWTTSAGLEPLLHREYVTRQTLEPAVNCQQCGCPSQMPYCNQAIDTCEAKCPDGLAFGQCATSGPVTKYCDNGVSYNACGTLCPGASCPIGSVCRADGRCVRCQNNSDCNDNNSCTNDTCIDPGQPGSYCRNDLRPNDCNPTSCGVTSPSGCHQCKCSPGFVCVPGGGSPNYCVYRPSPCDPKKAICQSVRGQLDMSAF